MARGSIRTRSKGSWMIRIDFDPDPLSGKRHQKTETVRGTKREAEKRLAQLLVEAEQGRIGLSGKMTVGEFLARWLQEHVEPNLSPKSIARYRSLVTHHIVPYIGSVQLDKLRPAHIISMNMRLRDACSADGRGKPLASSTRHYIHRVLHRALSHAIRWQLIAVNPTDAVAAPKASYREMQAFDAEQAQAVLQVCEDEGLYWQTFFTFAMTTGLRLGEILGLRWQDVDFPTGTLAVRQTVQRVPKVGIILKPPKTAGSRRPVSLGAGMLALLRRHRVAQHAARLALGPQWTDHDLVFPNRTGRPLEEVTVRKAFRRICARAGMPPIRLHDLRHTAATLMLQAGIHPKIVSERLGHSSVNITLNLYSHVNPTMQQDAAEKLDRLLHVGENADHDSVINP